MAPPKAAHAATASQYPGLKYVQPPHDPVHQSFQATRTP